MVFGSEGFADDRTLKVHVTGGGDLRKFIFAQHSAADSTVGGDARQYIDNMR